MALTNLGKAVLGTAFLLFVACGGDSFKANPNAVVGASQLGDMVAAAAQTDGLILDSSQTLPLPGDNAPSCNEQGMACSPGGSETGLDATYGRYGGIRVLIEVLIEPEPLDAKNAMQGRAAGIEMTSVSQLDPSACGPNSPMLCGPCHPQAAFNAADACAYSKYGAPKAGDHVLAYASDAVQGHNVAAVFFARDFLVGRVEVTAPTANAAKGEANRLAMALDGKMKQALSR